MLIERMCRAALLQSALYEEVEHDEGATGQALLVVVIAGLMAGVGAYLAQAEARGVAAAIISIVLAVIGALIAWVVWSFITYFVGTKLFNGTALTPSELLRTLGFAHAPLVLNILYPIPVLGGLLSFVLYLWILVAGVIAVRQALDFGTGKAIATVIVGWLVVAAIMVGFILLGVIFAVTTRGL
jgi:hypothetical protein